MRTSRSPAVTRLAGVVAISVVALGPPVSAAAEGDTAGAGRQADYAAAADRHGVPLPVLLGVSYLESRWDTNGGLPSTSAGFGPMHLTDVAAVTAAAGGTHGAVIDSGDGTPVLAEDARGDDSRPARPFTGTAGPVSTDPAAQTIDAAAALTGTGKEALRTDAAENISAGAALLADHQRRLGGPTGAASDPAAWYGAVARYAGSTDANGAATFADEVYRTINEGASRITDDGHRVTLPATRVSPDRSWLDATGLSYRPHSDRVECPNELDCEWIPAPYQAFGDGDYGNHDLSDRPHNQKIRYIVIHDTEGSYAGTITMVKDPTYVSWQYTIRSSDGHVAQHVNSKDVAWQAGNWYINATSIGIEHEGYAARQGAWYTEALYRSSAKLVRYLAHRFNVPLDRAHIIGHDNVPGITPAYVRGMHWDPGPYWDWAHYFDLLKAPLRRSGWSGSELVLIRPDYATNQPRYTGCTGGSTNPCPLHGSTDVILRSAPDPAAPLVLDEGLHPGGRPSTMVISDHSARASTGQVYALAGVQGDWTAIWYLGQKAWFHNPASAPTAVRVHGLLVTPKAGRASVPVYGRAYPEPAAYPPGGPPVQAIVPLQYTFAAGQVYSHLDNVPSEYYRAVTVDGSSPGDWTVVRGQRRYIEVQFGHRVMFVNADDVDVYPTSEEVE